jgi:hypothetical protein
VACPETAELEAGASGSCSPRSSLRTTSARIGHEVIFADYHLFLLEFEFNPFACASFG